MYRQLDGRFNIASKRIRRSARLVVSLLKSGGSLANTSTTKSTKYCKGSCVLSKRELSSGKLRRLINSQTLAFSSRGRIKKRRTIIKHSLFDIFIDQMLG